MNGAALYDAMLTRGHVILPAEHSGAITVARRIAAWGGLRVAARRAPRYWPDGRRRRDADRPYTACLIHPSDPATAYVHPRLLGDPR